MEKLPSVPQDAVLQPRSHHEKTLLVFSLRFITLYFIALVSPLARPPARRQGAVQLQRLDMPLRASREI